MYDMATFSPTSGQIQYTLTAMAAGGLLSLHHFRYRSASNYYDAGDFRGGTNYWELANLISLYGGLSIWGLATLTQLFAVLGIAIELNIFIWKRWVGTMGSLLAMTVNGMLLYTYDLAYQDLDHTDTSRATKANQVYSAVYDDMMDNLVF